MNAVGIIKRVLPFFMTFVAGLVIAGFFVPLTAPSFNFSRGKRHHECRKIRFENRQLRQENERLRTENAEVLSLSGEIRRSTDVPPPPPPRPAVPRHVH